MSAYHHGNLHDTLIQAGDEVLKQHGPENLSLREIAKRVGVSHNAPYRHFKNKAELVDCIIEKTLKELAEQIEAAPLLYPASQLMQVQYVGRLWAHLVIHYPRKAHLLFSGLSTKSHHRAAHTLILQNISDLLGSTTSNPNSLALTIMASLRGLALMYTSDTIERSCTYEEEILNTFDQICENILASLTAFK